MDEGAIARFLERMNNDPELQAQFGSLRSPDHDSFVHETVRLASGAGISLTSKDIEALLAAVKRRSPELTQEELDDVAGGSGDGSPLIAAILANHRPMLQLLLGKTSQA